MHIVHPRVGVSVPKGGGIYNEGTLVLEGLLFVYGSNRAVDGGVIYNKGTLYQCDGTVLFNQAPLGTQNQISGDPAQHSPTSPGPGGRPEEGNRVLLDHKGKELYLPEAALKAHLNHGDEVIDEEGRSDDTEDSGRRDLR